MKYYIYVSDSKIDMLFPQVPHEIKKKTATEFKIDFKLFSASRKTESENDDNRFARLEAVVDFIREYGRLGTVDDPDEFIEGTMPMRWGDYGLGGWGLGDDTDSGVVYFGGQTETTIVGLGGSRKHLIGHDAAGGSHPQSDSLTPSILKYLLKELQLKAGPKTTEFLSHFGDPTEVMSHQQMMGAIALSTQQMSGPVQKLEFLAKRLAYGPGWQDEHVLLATPLYVASAD